AKAVTRIETARHLFPDLGALQIVTGDDHFGHEVRRDWRLFARLGRRPVLRGLGPQPQESGVNVLAVGSGGRAGPAVAAVDRLPRRAGGLPPPQDGAPR